MVTWLKHLDYYKNEEDFNSSALSEDDILQIETTYSIIIPDELKAVLLKEGSFEIKQNDDWGYFSIKFGGLLDIMIEMWGGDRPEFADMDKSDYDRINTHCFNFGYIFLHDNAHMYLFITTNGKFGLIEYDQDHYEDLHKNLFDFILTGKEEAQLLEEKMSGLTYQTFDSLENIMNKAFEIMKKIMDEL